MTDGDSIRVTRLRRLPDASALTCDWVDCSRFAFCERAHSVPPAPHKKGAWPQEWLPVCLTHAICDVEASL